LRPDQRAHFDAVAALFPGDVVEKFQRLRGVFVVWKFVRAVEIRGIELRRAVHCIGSRTLNPELLKQSASVVLAVEAGLIAREADPKFVDQCGREEVGL